MASKAASSNQISRWCQSIAPYEKSVQGFRGKGGLSGRNVSMESEWM